MTHDGVVDVEHEVPPAERVLPVLVREAVLLVRPERRVHQRPDLDQLRLGQ